MQPADGQHLRFPAERLPLRQRAADALRRVGRSVFGAAMALGSPAIVLVAMLFGASVCTVVGVHILAGTGWAYIASAGVLFGLAAFLARGMTGG